MTKKEANEYVKDDSNWWLHSENNMFKSETLSFNGLHFVRLSKKSVANIIEVYMGKEEERLEFIPFFYAQFNALTGAVENTMSISQLVEAVWRKANERKGSH